MRLGPFIIAIFLAALAGIMVLRAGGDKPTQQITKAATPQAPIETTTVYVAAQFIPVGTKLTQQMLIAQPWPKHLMVPGFVVADGKTTIDGMVTRAPFQPQEPLITTKLANLDDPSFLAGNLPKGMRVISLRTNEIDGLAGHLFPGDRIDIMLTREVADKVVADPNQERFVKRFKVTETVLTNGLVLAVDQATEAVKPLANPNAPQQQQQRFDPPRSISLMVTPVDARRLRLAERLAGDGGGNAALSVALRSIEDKDNVDPLGITYVNDVSQYRPLMIGAATQQEMLQKASLVTVVRGVQIEDKQGKKRQLDLEDNISSSGSVAAGGGVVAPSSSPPTTR